MKKLRSTVMLLIIVCICFAGSASAQDSGYDITAYHTDIRIDKDNTYHVTESVTLDYHEPRHGILRYIPYKQQMEWEIDGETVSRSYLTRIEAVQVDGAPFKTYQESGSMVIQIGDPNQYVSGEKTYEVSYDHVLSDDKLAQTDFVYYNLIPSDWDCDIDNVTFSVTLPEGFDSEKVWFYSGAYGSGDKAPVEYSIDGNTISGSLSTKLLPYEGLTLQIDLPEGYFDVPPPFPWQPVLIGLALIIGALFLLLFFLYGKDGPLVTPVEFYAPEGITSAEAGYIIDTAADDKDVVSLILYWASKGYLSIDQIAKDDFTLIKRMELPDSALTYEKHMFHKLFGSRDSVTVSKLKETFYTTVETVKNLVADRYSTKENRLYTIGSRTLGWLARLAAVLVLWGSIYVTAYEATYSPAAAMVFASIGTVLIALPLAFLQRTLFLWQATKRASRSFRLVVSIVLSVAVMLFYTAYMSINSMAATGLAVSAVTLLLSVLSVFMRKRTKRGSELLGRLLGFKNFLERAERDRIERLVEENPSYFYDTMPFAYVLGVTDKWAKKFEGIAMRPPEWYSDSYGGMGPFSPYVFQSYLFHSMMHMRTTMASRPVQQINTRGGMGGGSFGGGGFSGGGFGGGGGRGW